LRRACPDLAGIAVRSAGAQRVLARDAYGFHGDAHRRLGDDGGVAATSVGGDDT
jgi:hypothetical protein